MTSINTKTLVYLLTFFCATLFTSSCGNILDINDPGCISSLDSFQNATQDYLNAINRLSTESQTNEEVSQEACDQYKNNTLSYIQALDDYIDCIDVLSLVSNAELNEFKDELRQAEIELEQESCN
jgi:hypothetical protein